MMQLVFPEIKLIANKENVGFSKANNQGVAIAKGEYVCILNPDTVVAEHTFTRLLQEIKDLPYSGMLGTQLIDGTGKFLPESKRNIPSPLTAFRRLFGIRLGNVKSYYADHVKVKEIGDIQVLVGAFMFVKRTQYLEVNGFDEDYFMYGEDIDLSYKMLKSGYHNYYVGTIATIHYKGESTARNKEYLERFYGAMQLFYEKHFKSNRIFDTFIFLGIQIISFVKSKLYKERLPKQIDQYFIITNNKILKNKVEKALNEDVVAVETISGLIDRKNKTKQIILDNEYLSFAEIIDTMQKLQDKNTTFKIKPANCNYIIGSNYSDEKGEVIKL